MLSVFALLLSLIPMPVFAAITIPEYVHTNEYKQLNNIYFYQKSTECIPGTQPQGQNSSATSGATPVAGETNTAYIYNYFISKGLSPVQALGIVGNILKESGGNPAADQKGGPGFGLAQWTEGGPRWKELVNFAKNAGAPISDLQVQLDFIWYELTTSFKDNTLTPLMAATTVRDATSIFMNQYERPLERINNLNDREELALLAAQALGVDVGAASSTQPTGGAASSSSVNCTPTTTGGAEGSGGSGGSNTGCAANIPSDTALAAVAGTVLISSTATDLWKQSAYAGATAAACSELVLSADAAAALAQAAALAAQYGVTLTGTAAYRSLYEQCSIYIKNHPRPPSCPSWITPVSGNWTTNTLNSNHTRGLSVDFTSASEDWMRKCATQNLDGTADGKCYGFYDDVYRKQGWDSAHFTYKP